MKNKKAQKNKKGFTLIEIIVVLVIIAILAAAGIPSMMNFIGQARSRALAAEGRTCYIAVQAVYNEMIMTNAGVSISGNAFTTNSKDEKMLSDMLKPDIDFSKITFSYDANNVLQWLRYDSGIYSVLYYRDTVGGNLIVETGKTADMTFPA